MRTIVFDLDGTLADTSGDLIAAANHCFAEIGVSGLDPVRDAATALRGGRAMLRLGLSRVGRADDEAMIDAYYPVLLRAYESAIDTHTRFFPNALETVDALRARGDRAVVCTNKPEALAYSFLKSSTPSIVILLPIPRPLEFISVTILPKEEPSYFIPGLKALRYPIKSFPLYANK